MQKSSKQQHYIQEDEIDLRELFIAIWNKRVFIMIFTIIVMIVAVIYSYIKTPIYEVKATIEVGSLNNSNNSNNNNSNNNNNNNNNNYIENPRNLIKRLQITNVDNVDKNQDTLVSSISLVKSTQNLIEIVAQAKSNKDATALLGKIINGLKAKHKKLVDNYKSLVTKNINNLKSQKESLDKKENRFEGSLAIKFDLTSKINELELQISSYNIQETKQIGQYTKSKYPTKPKKKLIIIVSFVTGLILSIFLVFFMQFVQNIRKER